MTSKLKTYSISIEKMATSSAQMLMYLFSLPPIWSTIINELGATSLSALCYAFNLELSDEERELLSPIRDMPEIEDWVMNMIAKGHEVRLVGADLHKLVARINNPETLAHDWATKDRLVIWPAVASEKAPDSGRTNDRHADEVDLIYKEPLPCYVRDRAESGPLGWDACWWKHESANENGIQVLFATKEERTDSELPGVYLPSEWKHGADNMSEDVRRLLYGDGVSILSIINANHDMHTVVDIEGMRLRGSQADALLGSDLCYHDNIFVHAELTSEDVLDYFAIPLGQRGLELAYNHLD